MAALACAILATCAPLLPAQSDSAELYSQKANLVTPNAIIVADLVHTPTPEIIVTDAEGRLRLHDSATGQQIQSRKFGTDALTAAAVGDFLGRNTLDIAVGTVGGSLLIIDGSSLDVVRELDLGAAVSIQPTVLPDAAGTGRDFLVLADQNGSLHGIDAGSEAATIIWTIRTGSKFDAPPAIGNPRNPEIRDAVIGTADGRIVVVEAESGRNEETKTAEEDLSIPVTPLLVDINGNRTDEIIIAQNRLGVRALRWPANRNETLREIWRATSARTPVSSPLLLSRGPDIGSYRILQITQSSIQVLEATSGTSVAEEANVYQGISTGVGLIPRGNQYPELAFGMRRTFHTTTNLSQWMENGGTIALDTEETALQHQLEHTVLIAATEQGGDLLAIGISKEQGGQLYAFFTGHTLSVGDWPTLTPWMGPVGSPTHSARLNRGWAQLEAQRRDALDAQAAEWRTNLDAAMAAGDWARASQDAALLLEYHPYNSDYSSLRLQIWVRKNLVFLLIGGVLVLALGGTLTWFTLRGLTHRRLRLRAETAVARNEFEEAARFYRLLLNRVPRNNQVAYALARVHLALQDYSAETLDVYAQAHEARPDDANILTAYARALLLEPKTDATAAAIYTKALPTFPEPALLEYGLGRHFLAAGNHEEAGKRLRSALRGGVSTDALYSALCDVYLATSSHTAKALPVYQQQFPARREDRAFLEAYLGACIDAKKMDQQVETLCQEVLQASPGHVPAYLHLARILMQKNQTGQAIEEIQNALERQPGEPEATALLAQAYMNMNRRDDEALRAFRGALQHHPEDSKLLRNLSSIYAERQVFDEDAVAIYHRALEHNPGDVPTLRALAQTALLTNDHQLSIRSLESLAHHATLNAKQTQQLANAYVRCDVHEPKAEKVYKDALREEPGNAEYQAALARVYTLQDRDDADCLPVYEAHLHNNPDDIAVGRQLAKALIKANRYDQALELAQRFLQQAPGDEEFQRLNALASLYGNKIDEAVAEYQRMLERNPSDEQALVNLALAYVQKLRTDEEARGYYERALRIQPDQEDLHVALGRLHAINGDSAAAVDAYKAALKSGEDNKQRIIAHMMALLGEHPEILRVRWFLVEVLVSVGHLREALEQIEFISNSHQGQTPNVLSALESILKRDANNLTALSLQGSLLLSSGQTDKAVRVLEKVHNLQPTRPEVQERLIEAYKAMLESRDDHGVRFRLGSIYYQQQEYDEAIGCFQKTSQDYRWEAESTKMLGKCFTGKGMLDLALQEYKKLVVDDETKELLYDLAQCYETKRDLVGAKTVYRQLFAADIDYKDVKARFEMLSGSTSDPMAFEKTSIVQQMSEEAARRYELLDELGRGAMGIVYRARDKELEEIVALKILPDNMSNNPEAVRRFKIEARNARKLSHPNIVRIHDIGEEMGRKYISMEYVDGSDLKKKMKSLSNTRLTHEQVLKYAMQIADALGYAHRLGIVHRDIKPANIMLNSSDDVKVTDFGIAKLMDSTGEGTMVGAVIGTPLYMSPEQVQGIPVDNRADIYSFGIMLYELFSGRPPFTEGDLAYQHIHKEPARIDGLPDRLWDMIARCLAKKKEDRWENAEQVFDILREYRKATA